MAVQQRWVVDECKQWWSRKQLCRSKIVSLNWDSFVFGSLVDVIVACVHLSLQVSSNDTSVEAMGLRKRLASKNVDLTKEERKMIRDILESYNE